MKILRIGLAYVLATLVTYLLAACFYTQQILSSQAQIGVVYTPDQTIGTYLDNIVGLAPAYGLILAIGLAIAFPIAALLKRILKPLARIAYPLAGAVAVYTAIYLIENVMATGGATAFYGARDAVGLALQCLAGCVGGIVFAFVRPK